MNRRLSSRLLGALLAPWFAFVVAEPVPMHACAMHSGHPGTPTAIVATSATHGGHIASPADAAAEHASTDAPAAPGNEHPCNCMGMGCQAAPVPLPSAQFSLVDVTSHRPALKVLPTSAAIDSPSEREHDRPFAIGPPAIRS